MVIIGGGKPIFCSEGGSFNQGYTEKHPHRQIKTRTNLFVRATQKSLKQKETSPTIKLILPDCIRMGQAERTY